MNRNDYPSSRERSLDLPAKPVAFLSATLQRAGCEHQQEVRPGGDLVEDHRVELARAETLDVIERVYPALAQALMERHRKNPAHLTSVRDEHGVAPARSYLDTATNTGTNRDILRNVREKKPECRTSEQAPTRSGVIRNTGSTCPCSTPLGSDFAQPKPRMNFASSDIRSGVQGGSKVRSSSTASMPSTCRAALSMSCAMSGPAGQPIEVRLYVIFAVESSTSTS